VGRAAAEDEFCKTVADLSQGAPSSADAEVRTPHSFIVCDRAEQAIK
jgi:hypothetical protein